MMTGAKRAFTLMEVNLAIFIMATGVLAMASLYSLGFRENNQSLEDVESACFADAYLAPLVAGLSDTNMEWSAWQQIGQAPSDGDKDEVCDGLLPNGEGWAAYVQKITDDPNSEGRFRVNNPNGLADQTFNAILGKVRTSELKGQKPPVRSDYSYGLVATRNGATISLAFRASHRKDGLMSQPVYYTEVHFQGRTDQ